MKKQLTIEDARNRINNKHMFGNNEKIYAIQLILHKNGSVEKNYFSPNWFDITNNFNNVEYIDPSIVDILDDISFKLYNKGYTKLRASVKLKGEIGTNHSTDVLSDVRIMVRDNTLHVRSRQTRTMQNITDSTSYSKIEEKNIYEINSVVKLESDVIISVIFVGSLCPPVVRIFKRVLE